MREAIESLSSDVCISPYGTGYLNLTASILACSSHLIISAVKSDKCFRGEEICISCFGRMPEFLTISRFSCYQYLPCLSDIIDLFLIIVAVWDICSSGCKIHDKKAVDLAGSSQFVPGTFRCYPSEAEMWW